ncbi:TIGR02300 family protein [Acetobacteraceae bacterium KSS8]|uniref:TIGR02300 family protein n=1 Tax=Endosaccharibacter trunci TaxID=2812733 RepID=A0ABT1W215_9PROT|nr:TIGR02300 family protein [Acetobacteraceae bacterium KSS8]
MAKPELGTKRVCVSCGARFYDLTKVPAVCPKCGTEQPLDQPRLRRSAGNLPADDRRPKKVAEADPDDTDTEIETDADEGEGDDVVEDTDDLDDDADVIGTDIEVETDNDDHEN